MDLNALNNLFLKVCKSCVLYCQSTFDNKNMGVSGAFLNKHLKLKIKGVVLKAHTTALITYFATKVITARSPITGQFLTP